MRAILLTVLVACGGCTQVTRCKSGSLLVSLSFVGAAAQADALAFTVRVGGGAPRTSQVTRKPGAADSIEIDFLGGYPQGEIVTVDVSATRAGADVGHGNGSATPAGSCDTLTIAVAAVGDGDMAAVAPGDLAGVAPSDLAGVAPSDLADVDLRVAPRDLARPFVPDLSTVENCFNGVDDNGDSKIDCADPACAAVASCVPSVAGVSYGTAIGGSDPALCPQSNAMPKQLYGDFTMPTCSGCTANVLGSPSITFYNTTNSTCGGGTIVTTSGLGCTTQATVPAGVDVNVAGLSCPTPSGTATMSGGSFKSELFCASPAVGGGCGAGSVCVPKVGAHTACILAPGAMSCAGSGYPNAVTPTTPPWHDSKDTSFACGGSCATDTVVPSVTAWVNPASSSSCSSGGNGREIEQGTCLSLANPTAGTFFVGGAPSYCKITYPTSGQWSGTGNNPTICCQ